MAESRQSEVPLTSVSAAAFTVFLRFLYCGRPPQPALSHALAIETLVLADKFDVPSLGWACEVSQFASS